MYPPQNPAPIAPQKQNLVPLIGRIIVLLILIGGLVFTISWVFGCSIIPIPNYCDLWYDLTLGNQGGKPVMLIVYGSSGLGDPEKLELALNDRLHSNARTRMLELSRISSGVLKKYQAVIVTHAKKMTSEQLKMFMDYVNMGGRLVWTGDAGTSFPTREGESFEDVMKRELLFEFEDPEQDSNAIKPINVWARKFEGNTIRFDKFISAKYLNNYCDEFKEKCVEENNLPLVGLMEKIEPEHDTVLGIKNGLKIYGNPARVELINSTTTSLIADVGSKQKRTPLIIESGFGGRVLYYALPLEEFVNENIPFDSKGNPQTAPTIIQKMYEASIK